MAKGTKPTPTGSSFEEPLRFHVGEATKAEATENIAAAALRTLQLEESAIDARMAKRAEALAIAERIENGEDLELPETD